MSPDASPSDFDASRGAFDAASEGSDAPSSQAPGRGFPATAPWVSFYGSAAQMGDLARAASTFRIINIDVDPGGGSFTDAQIQTLRAGGKNRVISYFNIGSCENYRTYWTTVPAGFESCGANTAAQLGPYAGYPNETWMNPGNAAYQKLMVDFVAVQLASRGIDGFYLDNMEVVEHADCDSTCRQGGLDLIAKLRARFPNLLIVMQNATSDVTRLGMTGGAPFPSLLDGIAHESVYSPYDTGSEQELLAWEGMNLLPGGRPFFIGVEDYVGSCTNQTAAKADYTQARSHAFSPYASDQSSGQQVVCYWGFLRLAARSRAPRTAARRKV